MPIRTTAGGIPVTLDQVATVQIGPEMRRGIAELNGEGEVASGIVLQRLGANALGVIERAKARLAEIAPSLPGGAEIVPVSAVAGDQVKLLEDLLVAQMPEGPPLYPGGELTDTPDETLVGELVREAAAIRRRGDKLSRGDGVVLLRPVVAVGRPHERMGVCAAETVVADAGVTRIPVEMQFAGLGVRCEIEHIEVDVVAGFLEEKRARQHAVPGRATPTAGSSPTCSSRGRPRSWRAGRGWRRIWETPCPTACSRCPCSRPPASRCW